MNSKIRKVDRLRQAQQTLDEEMLVSSRNCVLLLHEIDTLLLQIDHILNVSQPPLTGKIRIEWPVRYEGKFRPVPVVWTRLKGSEVGFRYSILPTANLPRRAKRAGPFAQNKEWISGLLVQVQWLLEMRSRVLKANRDYQLRIANMAEGNSHNFGTIRKMVTEVFQTLDLDPMEWVEQAREDTRLADGDDLLADE